MEGLSKGMMLLENAMEEEECGSIISRTANSCIVDSSVSDSKRVVCPNLSSFSTRQAKSFSLNSFIFFVFLSCNLNDFVN